MFGGCAPAIWRFEANTPVPVNLQDVDFVHIIQSAVEAARGAAENKGVHRELRVTRDPGAVRVDPHRVGQILWNLLSNAVKFTSSDGRIVVDVDRYADRAQVTVCDTGEGIAPDFLPHVFDRFQQADSSMTRGSAGSAWAWPS